MSTSSEQAGGKGRPTPTRKEAEAARKERVKPTLSRKEARRRAREEAGRERQRTMAAMKAGDETHYPPRDQGPVRAFVRDFVDSRRTFAEFFLPTMLAILLLTLIPNADIARWATVAWLGAMLLVFTELLWLGLRLRKQVPARFGPDAGRGNTFYGIVRATQIRRMRLPVPRVKPGQHT